MRFSRLHTFGICFAFVLTAAITAHGQSLPPMPHSPDLLGIYPGMPMNVARMTLQKHSSKYQVQNDATPEVGFSLTNPDPQIREMVNVYLTKAPNDPAVWLITKSQVFSPQTPMSVTALVTALREKYGKETLTDDRGGDGLYLSWLFDQNGRLLTSANPALRGCKGGSFVIYMRNRLPQVLNEDEKRCYASYFAVTAGLNRKSDPTLLEAYNVELVNLPYAFHAATVTANADNAAAEKARQEQMKKANKNKPDF